MSTLLDRPIGMPSSSIMLVLSLSWRTMGTMGMDNGDGSPDLAAAVDDQRLAGHERRLVTGEVEHRVRDVARLTDSADDDLAAQPLRTLVVRQHGFGRRRADQPG